MELNKLERLAKSLYEDFKNSRNPSDVYTNVMELAREQPDYFIEYLGAKNLLKLSILIWSLIRTDNFKLADKILNNMVFATFLDSSLEHPTIECEYCGGDGYVECSDCHGRGYKNCEECDGTGNVDCEECGADGEIETDGEYVDCPVCDGNTEVTCESCRGDGSEDCYECNGQGTHDCNECNGQGELEDDLNYSYSITYIITWNPQLIHKFQSDYDPSSELMDEHELSDYYPDYMITYIDDNNSASLNVKEGAVYLIDVDDDPKLKFYGSMRIIWDYDDLNIGELLR